MFMKFGWPADLSICRRGTAAVRGLWLVLGQPAVPASGQEEPVAEALKSKTAIDVTPITEAAITVGDRAHWAFAPVVRPLLPRAKSTEWARNGVDAFIQEKLEAAGIAPAPEAS